MHTCTIKEALYYNSLLGACMHIVLCIMLLLHTAALCHMLLDTTDSLDVIGNTIVGVRPLPQSIAVPGFTAILICAHKQTDNHITDI